MVCPDALFLSRINFLFCLYYSISHELRTPLHIILGILELLQANTEETLTEQQLTMLGSAEASGKGLIDTINNIIDLADLDPNNRTDVERGRKQLSDLFASVSEIDIRELCEEVAGSMAKRCVDKNLVINPSWSSAPLASLSSSSNPSSHSIAATVSASGTMSRALSNQTLPQAHLASVDDSVRNPSTTDSRAGVAGCNLWSDDHNSLLELIVAMDEPEETPEEDTHWSFMLNLPMVKRILTQVTFATTLLRWKVNTWFFVCVHAAKLTACYLPFPRFRYLWFMLFIALGECDQIHNNRVCRDLGDVTPFGHVPIETPTARCATCTFHGPRHRKRNLAGIRSGTSV